jgi:Zn-dependent protease with chaperone function
MSLRFASLLTLSYFYLAVFGVLVAVAQFTGELSLTGAIVITILGNVVVWLIGPWLSDIMYQWFHRARFLTPEEAKAQPWHPFAERVCTQHNIKVPRFAIIPDRNPTAFTYGSGAWNARVVLTQGLAEFLAPDEVDAVVGHELGHVVNRDFITMTVASTALQVLYQLYAASMRAVKAAGGSRGKGGGGALAIVGLAALVLFHVGQYLILYLSRVREYAADEFAAKACGDGNVLSRALLKIGYGIAASPDTESTAHLLRMTRGLGIFDISHAKDVALVKANARDDTDKVANALLFDLVSPWAWLGQLYSTHPLVGRRIARLGQFSAKPMFDFDTLRQKSVDRVRLYGRFATDVVVNYLPGAAVAIAVLAVLAGFALGEPLPPAAGVLLAVVYLAAFWIRLARRYPMSGFEGVTTLDCIGDIYASPVRGRPVELSGTVIGRGQPGFILGEDMMFRDRTGLIYLNYESAIPLLGNWFFAWRRVEALIDKPALARGWFMRGVSHHLELFRLDAGGEQVKSRLRGLEIFRGIVVAALIVAAFIAVRAGVLGEPPTF